MELAESTGSSVEYVGPFESYRVVVDGWQVPFIQAQPIPGGQVNLILDDRFGLDLSVHDAERVVPFLANAISVALGYAAHPSEKVEEPRAKSPVAPRRLRRLDWAETAEGSESELG